MSRGRESAPFLFPKFIVSLWRQTQTKNHYEKNLACFFVVALFGCGGGQQQRSFDDVKMDSYENSYEAFVQAVEEKDIAVLNHLSATSFPDLALIAEYEAPKVSLVPKQPDGAYGTIDKGTSMLYYLFIADKDVLREVRVLQLQLHGGNYKIWNYTPFKMSAEVVALYNQRNTAPIQRNTQPEVSRPREKARITNYDPISEMSVNRVNLWSSPSDNRKVVGYCVNNDEVEVLDRSGYYAKVRKKDGTEGWLMEEWLKK